MLKQIYQRLAFGRTSWDPVKYWRGRAADPATKSVMWANLAYNSMVDRDEWRIIESHLPERREAALDLGCGTGRMSARLAEHFTSYTGVDLDTMAAEAARRNPQLAGSFVAATIDDYAFPPDRFDFVLSLGCLSTACFADKLEEVAGRMVGSVRIGGTVLLIEPFHRSRLLTRGCRATPREVIDIYEGLGMKLEARSGMLFPPVRMTLGELPSDAWPRLTRLGYEAGERLVRLRPTLFADYSVLVFVKKATS